MPLIPIAAFLVGSLLSLVLPIGLLIAIAVWYVRFVRRMPDPAELGHLDPVAPSPIATQTAPASHVGEPPKPPRPPY